ncbi:homeobox protein 2-like [Clytia hemisphaerica]|uniref:homeobox protein 2-like n=1 Tax=Clytia hemisphaerica TaxID=252671 RepID=UPI0034D4C81F
MDINLLKEIKADRKHNRWQPLCDEARQNLITERRKDKKLEFKCLSPVTDTERIFDKNKDHQNLENVHQSLKKLANVYLCLHRYAINLINKRKEGNLAVIKIIKMYTGYWVSNFTTMEEIAIDNLHYLGYKPNGDQLILDTEEKPSYEAKTVAIDCFLAYIYCQYVFEIIKQVSDLKYSFGVARKILFKINNGVLIDDLKGICEREKLQERKDKDDDFNIRKEDFTSNHNHHIQQQPLHVNQHQSFQTPSNMDHHSSNHPLNRENPQKPTGISLYDNQQQSPTSSTAYPYASNGQPHSNLPQNQGRSVAFSPSLSQGQQPFGNPTHHQYYHSPSYQNPGQASEPQNFHNSNPSNYGNTHQQSNPTGHDLYGDANDDWRATEAETASPHSSEIPTHHQKGNNVNQQMHGSAAQQMDPNAHQQTGTHAHQQWNRPGEQAMERSSNQAQSAEGSGPQQLAKPIPRPRKSPANSGNMQNNPDSTFSTNDINETPSYAL